MMPQIFPARRIMKSATGCARILLRLPSCQANFDAPVDNLFPDDMPAVSELSPDLASQWKATASGNGSVSDDFDFADVLASPVTLRDHVAEQIAFGFADYVRAGICDRTWPMGSMIPAICASDVLRCGSAARHGPEDQPQTVLEQLQTFDPPGLFARDLAECLAIQLKAKDRLDPAMAGAGCQS